MRRLIPMVRVLATLDGPARQYFRGRSEKRAASSLNVRKNDERPGLFTRRFLFGCFLVSVLALLICSPSGTEAGSAQRQGHSAVGQQNAIESPLSLVDDRPNSPTATSTWSGGGSDDNWSRAANWSGNTAPQALDDLAFTNSSALGNTNNDLPAFFPFNSLTIVGGYTITGNTFGLCCGLTANLAGAFQSASIIPSIALSDSQVFTVNGSVGSTLVLHGLRLNANGLLIDGNARLDVKGAVVGTSSPGDKAFIVNGATLDLEASNTYQGITLISNGEVLVRNSNSLGAVGPGNQTRVSVNGSLNFNAHGNLTTNELLELNGSAQGAGALEVSNSTVLNANGLVTLVGNTTIGVTDAASQLFLTQINETGGSRRLTKIGFGELHMTNANGVHNTFTGPTFVDQGTLVLEGQGGNTTTIPGPLVIGNNTGAPGADKVVVNTRENIADTSPVTINPDGELELVRVVESIGSLSGDGMLLLENAAQLRVGGNNSPTTFSGTINGEGEILKMGGATLTLSGNSNFTGSNLVIGGSLRVDGSIPNSRFVLRDGTLSGRGTVGSIGCIPTAVSARKSIKPNVDAAGTLTTQGDVTLNAETDLVMNLNGTGPAQYDHLTVNGSTDVGNASLVLSLAPGFTAPLNSQYTILTSTSGITGRFQQGSSINVLGQNFFIAYNPTSVVLIATDSPPILQFTHSLSSVGEGDQQINVTILRSGFKDAAASVDFSTSDAAGSQNCNVVTGVASSRCDYETGIRTVKFAPGETAKSVSVFIIDDSYLEGPETFTVGLSNAFGASLGTQSNATLTITDNEIANGPNPVDTASFFVLLHYLDFLNREPDASGFPFWINEITSCGANQQCIAGKRINVSAAFYLSIEFQQTGYLVERIFKAAYGDTVAISTLGGAHQLSVPVVRLDEFLANTQEIGQGVVVNETGWQQVLENNKQAFTSEFVQRVRFTTAYPTSMTPRAFVVKLDINAGSPLSLSELEQLVNDLTSGAKTRAQVLRAVAEDSDLNNAEFNRAFVLMQYYGYLRRNPNDLPDSDYTGYDFWLQKLNQFGGSFVDAEMVKSFLVSGEYRHRFGP